MAFPLRTRTRGVNFLLGGTVVATGILLFVAFGGSFDIGVGAPDVRIDSPVSAANASDL